MHITFGLPEIITILTFVSYWQENVTGIFAFILILFASCFRLVDYAIYLDRKSGKIEERLRNE
jgi:hypothetical protein